ncbi:hypothetical protein ACFO6R_00250 [Eubacterium multiforme]|uniref:PH domain-containing protein n=1 Tax=Eubacterium multiforme TaxID=83339 RepID=A0ABT9UQA1_9FIRM|nr:hypothetical protein [Eubacterium multiforme]MDQ0148825.1 hypothetical protein [Eubacterium multiforme]
MDIYKALKKEKKSIKRFYILMIILAILLPTTLWLTGIMAKFYIIYVALLELLIFIAILKKRDYTKLEFSYKNNKLRFTNGLFSQTHIILCDKIAIVHTEGIEDYMKIILVSSAKIRNRRMKPISKGFLDKYPEVSEEYIKIKKINPSEKYYFQIIKKGGLKKYPFLNEIFKYCVKAEFTDDCIENIKIARGETLS